MLFLVDGFTKLHRDLRQGSCLFLHRFCITTFDGGLGFRNSRFDFALQRSVNLVAMLFELLFRAVHKAFGVVLGFRSFTTFLVFFSECFGITDHLINVSVGQTARSLDLDLLFLARALVLCGYADEAVGINVECHFNLRHAARCGWNSDEVKIAEQLVIRRHFTLALEHADGNRVLVIFRSRVNLALLRWDRRVPVDHAGEHTAQCFDTKRQRRYVKQQHVLNVALQYACLNSCAHGNNFVRVHTGVRFLAEERLNNVTYLWHAGHAANHDDFVNSIRL